MNSHINRLRAKIEQNPSQPEYIVTVWGVGYKLDARPQEKVRKGTGRETGPGISGTDAVLQNNIRQLRA